MSNTRSSTAPIAKETSEITRRTALQGIAAGGGAAAMALTTMPLSATAATLPAMNVQAMSLDHWNQFVGARFRVVGFQDEAQGQRAEVRLEKVIENDWIRRKDRDRPAQLRPASISLLFSANREIANSTYAIEHEKLGRSLWFLHRIPRAEMPDKKIYEVVLN